MPARLSPFSESIRQRASAAFGREIAIVEGVGDFGKGPRPYYTAVVPGAAFILENGTEASTHQHAETPDQALEKLIARATRLAPCERLVVPKEPGADFFYFSDLAYDRRTAFRRDPYDSGKMFKVVDEKALDALKP